MKKNTSGSITHDIHIVSIATTEKVVPSKKLYTRKSKHKGSDRDSM